MPIVSKNTNALKAHVIMAGLDRAINAGSTFCGAQEMRARTNDEIKQVWCRQTGD